MCLTMELQEGIVIEYDNLQALLFPFWAWQEMSELHHPYDPDHLREWQVVPEGHP